MKHRDSRKFGELTVELMSIQMFKPRVFLAASRVGTAIFLVARLEFRTASLPPGPRTVFSFMLFVDIVLFLLMLQPRFFVGISGSGRESFGFDSTAHACDL